MFKRGLSLFMWVQLCSCSQSSKQVNPVSLKTCSVFCVHRYANTYCLKCDSFLFCFFKSSSSSSSLLLLYMQLKPWTSIVSFHCVSRWCTQVRTYFEEVSRSKYLHKKNPKKTRPSVIYELLSERNDCGLRHIPRGRIGMSNLSAVMRPNLNPAFPRVLTF